ncbi:hypothetical protein LARV_00643 [Longilinea arvoryzae]|uniref:Uncharacterized protein n=1 Tax=Longilinea arvoryzae TaxID=360412 RepID=A0A0S7B731_9CHLR|nr:hypothetical protein [Longilinea arvoryzae]GAP12903.1 hypothetical protein LARV_00643 [Longilinea arvoryzae]
MYSLRIACGSETVWLHGPSIQPPVKGARRLPIPRALEGGRCEEQIDLLLEGTPASVQWMIQTIERLLARARTGAGAGLHLMPSAADTEWEACLLDGRVELLGAGTPERGRGSQALRLFLVRGDCWQGSLTALPLSNPNGANVTNGLTLFNHCDADALHANYADSNDAQGSLPAPARVELFHDLSGPEPVTDIWLGEGAAPLPHDLLEGEAATTTLTTQVIGDSTCSGGGYRRVSWEGAAEVEILAWELNSNWLEQAGGRCFRPLLRFANLFDCADLQVHLQVHSGGSVLFESPFQTLQPGARLQELAPVMLPPWSLAADSPAGLALAWIGRRVSGESTTLDLDFLALLPLRGWRRYWSLDGLPAGARLLDDPLEQRCVTLHPQNGELAGHVAQGPGLEVQPGQAQCFAALFATGSPAGMDTTARVRLKITYRPRRRTV